VATKTQEPVINTLAAVSVLRQEQITQAQPSRLSDIFNGMPGVWFSERGDDPAAAINIRGLQDFGRVAVLVDGARQDFQRSGHFANGQFYIDPEFLGGVDVVRGPVANVTAQARSAALRRSAPRSFPTSSCRARSRPDKATACWAPMAVNGSRRPSRARAVRPAIFLPAASIATA
jgi:glutaredoxin-related protein